MWHVSLAVSGTAVVDLDAGDFEEKSGRRIKEWLVGHTGFSRFQQRLFLEDQTEVSDDDVLLAPQDLQLVLLDFCPADMEQDQALMASCEEGDVTKVERILRQPRNPNVADDIGMTPLHHAARHGRVGCTCMLLEAGAEKEPQCHRGENPLHLASLEGHLGVVKVLVEVGCDVNKTAMARQ